ncbi:MAG: heparan-alpha-glucosaminide N-acetyltransferase [Alphaproteobacteria bacterium]|nr:heparan-alpha-glucosaminide N-acetyltransferase [Alphaproteobacteria bacterium]
MPRIALVDFLRGMTLLGMTVFHFVYDLEFFGLEEYGYSDQLHWWTLATIVAGSFLFLTGASLYLAHSEAVRWRPWGRRLVIIVLAALSITIATRFVTPESYVFFGILHMIAIASIAGLAFLRAPWWLAAAAAAAILLIDEFIAVEWLNAFALSWLGLGSVDPVTSDFRPVFPWLAPAVLGVGAAKMCHLAGWLKVLAAPRLEGRWGTAVRFIGRHSLVYYLLHQPVLFALFWTWLQLAGQ